MLFVKWVVVLSALLFAGAAAGPGRNTAMSKTDEAEVLRLENEFLGAWNRGDARGAAAVFAEDGVRIGAFGDVAQGRREIEAAYEKLLGGPMKGATASVEMKVRFLAVDVALVQGPLTIHPSGGAPPIRGYAVDIWRKQNGRWWLLEGHPKLFPPPPGK